MMSILKNATVNAGLKAGMTLMRIPAAAIGGVWKTLLRVAVVLVETVMETLGIIRDCLKDLQE